MSGLLNKVKDAMTGTKHTPEAEAANQGSSGECIEVIDIMLIVNRWCLKSEYGNTGHSGQGSGVTGSNTAGPHNSSLGNKLDPRVDNGTVTIVLGCPIIYEWSHFLQITAEILQETMDQPDREIPVMAQLVLD